MKLYGFPASPNTWKVRAAAHQMGIPLELELVDLTKGAQRKPEYMALNPTGRTPTLVDGDFVLWESNAICRYLAGKHPRGGLLPEDPRARAQVEQWMDWQATELNNSWRYAFLALVRRNPEYTQARDIAESLARWHKHMRILDEHFAHGGQFVTGEFFTLADVVLGLSVHRWLLSPIERPPLDAVHGYYQRLSVRPAFRAHVDPQVP